MDKDNTGDNVKPLLSYKTIQKYLKDRGIGPEIVERLGWRIQTARQYWSEQGQAREDPRLALVFPHVDWDGHSIDWHSTRFVGEATASAGWAAVLGTTAYRDRKMHCKAGVPPHAYLCPLFDWTRLEARQRVYIHESVVKATAGALALPGSAHVGLNGVYGYSARRHGAQLVHELATMPWVRLDLQPFIVYDSNWENNWHVAASIDTLAHRLNVAFGREVRHLPLPAPPEADGDWGFDDARVALGDEWAREYLEGEGREVAGNELQMGMAQLNTEVVVVEDISKVAHIDRRYYMGMDAFKNVNYADRWAQGGERPVSIPAAWLRWGQRRVVPTVEYAPGRPPVVDGEFFNRWRYPPLNVYEGDIGPLEGLLDNCVADNGMRQWMVQWLAWPIAHPGEKLPTCLVLVGPQGVGKSRLADLMCRVYGVENSAAIGRDDLVGNTGDWGESELVVIDEMTRVAARHAEELANTLKKVITSETLAIKQKYVPEYHVANRVNFLITTNYVDSVRMDEDDRRFAVVEFEPKVDNRRDAAYWREFSAWMDGDGAGAVRWWFENKVDFTGFDPYAWAPESAVKEEMKLAGREPMEAWVLDLLQDPGPVLDALDNTRGLDLWSTRMLYSLYDPDTLEPRKGMVDRLSLTLKRARVPLAEGGKKIKVGNKVLKFWAIRNADKYQTGGSAGDHLRKYATTVG